MSEKNNKPEVEHRKKILFRKAIPESFKTNNKYSENIPDATKQKPKRELSDANQREVSNESR
ncbi:MAG: hypothetical protein KBD76_07150 [Bacteriovorax sp.]|nr:hypothetical protein [Bacteriovorax sp.]